MRLAFVLFVFTVHISFCSAAGAPSPEQTKVSSTTSSAVLPKHTPTATNSTRQAPSNFSLYDKLPKLWFETCADNNQNPPCTAYCRSNDTECLDAANVVVPACAGIWNQYNGRVFDWRISGGAAPSEWSTIVSTYGADASPSTTIVNVYTSFSTANVSIIRQNPTDAARLPKVTITPVYAIGTPVPSVSVETASPYSGVVSYITAPQPSCRYAALKTTNDCGQCSIYGGTVELLFWPPATTSTSSSAPIVIRSTVWDGITLVSPTVYISLSTVYASNSCMQVGRNHTGTLLAMNPKDVSTQIHIGGKVAAYTYGRVNYADLVGLPPLNDYEAQPSCIMFGCSTILPTYSPTLVVPLALRTLEPDWNSCVTALEGLYDPPIALTEAAVAVLPTVRSRPAQTEAILTTTLPSPLASQCITPAVPTPTPTSGSINGVRSQISSVVQALESILNDDGGHSYGTSLPDAPALATSASSSTLELNPLGTPSDGRSTSFLGSSDSSRGDSHRTYPGLIYGSESHAQQTYSTISVEFRSSIPTLSIRPSQVSASTRSEEFASQPISVGQDSYSNLVVNGKTFDPSSPITLTRADTTLVASMFISSERTYIALGTTATVPFGDIDATPQRNCSAPPPPVNTPLTPTQGPAYTAAGLTFEANSDGDLIISSSTLRLGNTMTLDSGGSYITVLATEVGSQTAIVVDNTTSAILVGQVSSTAGRVSHGSSAAISSASVDGSGMPQAMVAKTTDSEAACLRVAGVASVLLAVLNGIVLGM